MRGGGADDCILAGPGREGRGLQLCARWQGVVWTQPQQLSADGQDAWMIAILFDSVDDCSHACLSVLSGSTRPVISDLRVEFCGTEDRGVLDRRGLAWIKARLTGSRASRSNAAHLADTACTQRPTSACPACLHRFNTLYPPPTPHTARLSLTAFDGGAISRTRRSADRRMTPRTQTL